MATNNFLEKTDYYQLIEERRLNQILENNDALLEDVENTAEIIIRDALHTRFDVDTIFSKTGDDRPRQVLRWMLNISLYLLYERVPESVTPKRVIDNYDETMQFLTDIEKGIKSVLLPRVPDEETPKTRFRWGSQESRTHDIYE